MSLEEFNKLPENQQKAILVDAQKLDERTDSLDKYEFFEIEDFFVEVKTSFAHRYRKIINCYTWKNIPGKYLDKVIKYILKKKGSRLGLSLSTLVIYCTSL